MRPRTLTRSLPLLLLCLLFSCSSWDRLTRVGPLGADGNNEERVNLWPLYWGVPGSGSILWPLVDFDDKGFAIRPVVAKDGQAWEFAYPLSHMEQGAFSWVVPFYWTRSDKGMEWGLFPLVHADHGPYGEGWIAPFWWSKQGGEVDACGLFPLASWGGFQHVGPLWRQWDHSRVTLDSAGLFPLVWWSRFDDSLHIFPLYSKSGQWDYLKQKFLPGLAGSRQQGEDEWRHWAAPLYHYKHDGDNHRLLTPLVSWGKGNTGGMFNIHPLWWSFTEGTRREQLLVPLYYHRQIEGRDTHLTPLGGWGWDEKGKHKFVNVCGPLFYQERGEDYSLTAFLWPLFQRETDGPNIHTRLFPIINKRETPEFVENHNLLGLHHSWVSGDRQCRRLSPLISMARNNPQTDWAFPLSLLCVERAPDKESTVLLGGVLLRHERDSNKESTDLLGGLLLRHEHDHNNENTELVCGFLGETDRGYSSYSYGNGSFNAAASRSGNFPGFLYGNDAHWRGRQGPGMTARIELEGSSYLFPLGSLSRKEVYEWPTGITTTDMSRYCRVKAGFRVSGDETAWARLLEADIKTRPVTSEGTSSLHVFPALYESEVRHGKVKRKALFRLFQHKSHAGGSRTNILWGLYRRERTGESIRRDVFPFLRWDNSPDKSRFSFAWRFLDIHREGGNTRGHVLFVPFGG